MHDLRQLAFYCYYHFIFTCNRDLHPSLVKIDTFNFCRIDGYFIFSLPIFNVSTLRGMALLTVEKHALLLAYEANEEVANPGEIHVLLWW